MNVYAINHALPGKYDTQYSQTQFLLDGMTRDEFVASRVKNGTSMKNAHAEFSKAQMDAISANFDIVNSFAKSQNSSVGFELPTVSRYVDTLNQRAARQVFGPAFSRWEAASNILHGAGNVYDSSQGRNRFFGFDLETFGDIQNAKGIFGITEIGIGELQLRGNNDIGDFLGTEHGYAAFAVAPTATQQQYFNSVLNKIESSKGGFDALTKEEKVVAERLSRYGGTFAERFGTIGNVFFESDPDKQYYVVKSLADKNITTAQIKEGIENLKKLSTMEAKDGGTPYRNPLVGIVNYLTSSVDVEKDFIYGANSHFDFEGLSNAMMLYNETNVGGTKFTAEQFKKINALKESALDVTYAIQAAAASHNMDVARFQEEILGAHYSGATMEEQLRNFYFSAIQTHHSLGDTQNEGKVLVHHISQIFDKHLAKGNSEADALRARINESKIGTLNDARFYVRRGALNYTHGNEFGIVTSAGKDAPVSSVSLNGQWWQIDPERTSVIGSGDSKRYVFTLANSADLASNKSEVARASFVFSSPEEAYRRFSEIMKNSYTESSDNLSSEALKNAQMTRYFDIGRREIDKLFSTSDIRVESNNADTTYGYKQIKKIIAFREQLEKSKAKTNLLLGDSISLEDRFSRRAVNQLQRAASKIKNSPIASDIARNTYQAESFLSINAMLDSDKDLLQRLTKEIDAAFAGKTGTEYDAIKTVAFKKAYDTALSIATNGTKGYSSDAVRQGFEFAIDSYGVDIVDYLEDKYWRADFSGDITTAVNGIQRALNSADKTSIHRMIGDPEATQSIAAHSLFGRGLITQDQARSILNNFNRPDSNNYMLAQEIATAIRETTEFTDRTAGARLKRPQSYTDETLSKMFHGVLDLSVLDKPTRISETGDILETGWSQVSDSIHRIANLGFTNINSGLFKVTEKEGKAAFSSAEGQGVVDAILTAMNVDSADYDIKRTVVAEMFEGKKYSVGSFADRGLQAFVVMPDQVDGKAPTSAFMVLTNKEHSARAIELITEASGTDTFSSFSKATNSELAEHGAIIELPHIIRRVVEGTEDKPIASLVSVRQGDSFERFILPELELYKDKVYFNNPDYKILSLFRQGGQAALEHVWNGDFKQATRAGRRIFDELMKNSPASASYHGVNYQMHFNPNDEMRAYEVRLVKGVSEIFNKAALLDFDKADMNPAQQIVADFVALQRGELVSQMNIQRGDIESALKSNAWQEFFRRHFVSSPIANGEEFEIVSRKTGGKSYKWNEYLTKSGEGRYRLISSEYDYEKATFLSLTRAMAESGKFGNRDEFGNIVPFIDSETAKKAFSHIPDKDISSLISMIGSESQVEHGSVFFGYNPYTKEFFARSFADYHPLSGMYNMMRPLYIQQGNPMTYTLDEVTTALPVSKEVRTIDLLNYTTENGLNINPISFTDNAHANPIEQTELNAMKLIGGQEHEFNLKVKHMSEDQLHTALSNLEKEDVMKSVITRYTEAGRFGKGSEALITNDTTGQAIYKEIANALRQDFGSLHEDKALLSPAIKQTGLFQKRDAAVLDFDWSKVDLGETKRALMKLSEENRIEGTNKIIIHTGDIIGRRQGRGPNHNALGYNIVNTKSDLIVTIDQLEDFITNRPSGGIRVETVGDIVDDKIMLFGLEKATTHSVNLEAIEKILKKNFTVDDATIKEEALRIATAMYHNISDGAGLIINPGYLGHGGIPALESNWNVIVSNYRKAGRLNDLSEMLNNEDIFGQFYDKSKIEKYFSVDPQSGRFITNLSQINKQAKFIKTLQEHIGSLAETDATAKTIMDEIQYNIDHNLLDATAHRQIMNDHMGRSMMYDLRMQQAVGIRNMTRDGGLDENSLKLARAFKEDAYGYSSKYSAVFGTEGREQFIRGLNYNAGGENYERAIYNAHQQDAKRTLTGMAESYEYFRDGKLTRADIKTKNIVSISIDDILSDVDSRVSTGINVSDADLEKTLFFIDGKPSDFLINKAREAGISQHKLETESFSLFIDLGGYKSVQNGHDVEGLLVPLQNMSHIEGDKTLFRSSPGAFAGFMRKVADTIKNKKADQSSDSFISGEIYRLYDEYMTTKVLPETNLMRKNSDAYKILQQFIVPNSSELQAQDEAPALLKDAEEVFGNDFKGLLNKRNELQKQIREHVSDSDIAKYIAEYNVNENAIKTRLKDVAKEIADPNSGKFRELMSLGQSKAMQNATSFELNGTHYNGIAVGLSEAGFTRLGLNIKDVGRDILEDYQLNGFNINTSKFAYIEGEGQTAIENAVKSTINRLNANNGNGSYLKRELEDEARKYLTEKLGFDPGDTVPTFKGKVVTSVSGNSSRTITQQLDDYISDVQQAFRDINGSFTAKAEFNTRDINEEIAGRIQNRFRNAFGTDIGKAYLGNVGIYADLGRFPIFRSQSIVKLVFDDTIEGVQARISNPILSAFTNLDFDGDKIFLATMLNGTSILEKGNEKYSLLKSVYEKTIAEHSSGLLADIVKSGKMFNVEDANDWAYQAASLYQVIEPDKFEEDALSFLKKFDDYADLSKDEFKKLLRDDTIATDNKGLWYALMHSSDVVNGYFERANDVTRTEAAEMAALTARFRKNSIGSISTPGFRIRESIFMTLQQTNSSLTDSEKSLLNNLLLDLSNIDSKSGGLLSLSEQKAIDVKHLKDTALLSRAEEFAKHAYGVLGRRGDDKEHIVGMINALGKNIIDPKDISVENLVDKYVLANDSIDILTKIIETNEKNGPVDAEMAKSLMALSRLQKASANVLALQHNFNNFINAQTYDNLVDWFDQFDTLSESQQRSILENYFGTASGADTVETFMARSSYRSPVQDGQIVFVSGDASNGFKDTLYQYSIEKEALKEIGSNNTEGFVNIDIANAEQVLIDNKPILSGDYTSSKQLRTQAQEAMSSTKLERALNSLTLSDTEAYSAIKNLDISLVRSQSGDVFADTMQYLVGSNAAETAGRIRDITDTYAYLMSQKGLVDAANDNPAAHLLRQLNEQISKSGGHIDVTGVGDSLPLDAQYAHLIKSRPYAYGLDVSGEEFGTAMQKVIAMRNSGSGAAFSFDTYSRQLDFLQKNVYDIVSSQVHMESSFNSLESGIQGLDPTNRGVKNIQEILSNRADIMNKDLQWSIGQNYAKVTGGVQRAIYDAFQDTGDAMKMASQVFNWEDSVQGNRLIGFGTYMGKKVGSLSAEDIKIINMEADWLLSDKATRESHAFLETAINKTREIIAGYEPVSTKSAFDGTVASGRITMKAQLVDETAASYVEIAKRWQEASEEAKKFRETIEQLNGNIARQKMRRETVSGGFFEQAKQVASKLTGQQIAAGIAAMAGIGLVNKLLHSDGGRSPLEAGHSGAKQPPIINGQQISSGGAPATPGGFGRTIYHDQGSGFNFHVSASTSRRLSAINGAQGIGLAGGGDTQVYAFNDTRGVSDNWLANKFAELAE